MRISDWSSDVCSSDLLIAIADVAHYVRPDSALDRAAYARGNSTYFPNRVLPMLPPALSNGWCSLNPREDRPCLAVHPWIEAKCTEPRHPFLLGLMRPSAPPPPAQVPAPPPPPPPRP